MLRVAAVLAATLLSIASCFIKPDRPESGTARDGGTGRDADVSKDGDTDAAGCAIPVDDFNSSSGDGTCGAWGTVAMLGSGSNTGGLPGTVGRDGARLRMVPPESLGAGIQCETTTRFDFSRGTSVRISAPLSTNTDDQTFLRVVLPNETTAALAVYRDASGMQKLRFECGGSIARNDMVLSTGWLKLVGKDDGQSVTITAQYTTTSATAGWTDYASCVVNDAFGDIHIAIGTQLGSGSSGNTVMFDDLNVGICQ